MNEGKPQMTVAELIAALQAVENQDLPVTGEGCDCTNPVVGVEVYEHDVWITVRV